MAQVAARTRGSRAALTGIVFIVLVIASFITGGSTPEIDASPGEITSYYDEPKAMIATIMLALAAVVLIFFVGVLRSALRTDGGTADWLPNVAFAGGVVMAVGLLIFAGLQLTLVDAVDTLSPAAAEAINALNIDLFFPVGAGIVTLLMATGLSLLRTKVLPIWLAWAGIVIALVAFTPIGFFAFLASQLWILVTSILLVRGAGATAQT